MDLFSVGSRASFSATTIQGSSPVQDFGTTRPEDAKLASPIESAKQFVEGLVKKREALVEVEEGQVKEAEVLFENAKSLLQGAKNLFQAQKQQLGEEAPFVKDIREFVKKQEEFAGQAKQLAEQRKQSAQTDTLKKIADFLGKTDEDGHTPFHQAAQLGDFDAIYAFYCALFPQEYKDTLSLAALENPVSPELQKQLCSKEKVEIAQSAEKSLREILNLRDKEGCTFLHLADRILGDADSSEELRKGARDIAHLFAALGKVDLLARDKNRNLSIKNALQDEKIKWMLISNHEQGAFIPTLPEVISSFLPAAAITSIL